MKRLILFMEIVAFAAVSYLIVLVLPYLAIRMVMQWLLNR